MPPCKILKDQLVKEILSVCELKLTEVKAELLSRCIDPQTGLQTTTLSITAILLFLLLTGGREAPPPLLCRSGGFDHSIP